jgi:hypothetical protein
MFLLFIQDQGARPLKIFPCAQNYTALGWELRFLGGGQRNSQPQGNLQDNTFNLVSNTIQNR